MIFQSFPASSPCFLYPTFCFFCSNILVFSVLSYCFMQKTFQIFGVFPEKHYLCICKLILTHRLSRTCSSVGQSNRLIIWRSLVQAQAGPQWKSSSYDKIVAAFSFSWKTMGKHIDFENSLIFRYTWHHIIPSKACKQGFSEYQNNLGKQQFYREAKATRLFLGFCGFCALWHYTL